METAVSCSFGKPMVMAPFLFFFFDQVDLFKKSLLLIPIHLEVHWSLITVTLSNRIISFYDSQGIHFKFCVGSMRKYLLSEAKEKNRPEFLQAWQADDTECVPTEKRAVTVESFSPHRPQKALQVPLQRAVFSEFT